MSVAPAAPLYCLSAAVTFAVSGFAVIDADADAAFEVRTKFPAAAPPRVRPVTDTSLPVPTAAVSKVATPLHVTGPAPTTPVSTQVASVAEVVPSYTLLAAVAVAVTSAASIAALVVAVAIPSV